MQHVKCSSRSEFGSYNLSQKIRSSHKKVTPQKQTDESPPPYGTCQKYYDRCSKSVS
jgi:hypothetical protein